MVISRNYQVNFACSALLVFVVLLLGSCQGRKAKSVADPVSNADAQNNYVENYTANNYIANNGGDESSQRQNVSYNAQSYNNFESSPDYNQDYDQYEANTAVEVTAPVRENNSAGLVGENIALNQSPESFNARAAAPVTAADFTNEYPTESADESGYQISQNSTNQVEASVAPSPHAEVASTAPLVNGNQAVGGVSLPSSLPLSDGDNQLLNTTSTNMLSNKTSVQGGCECPTVRCACPATTTTLAASLEQHPFQASSLDWVGYDYRPDEGVIRIEMVTQGSPQFSLFQNRRTTELELGVHEVVVRFLNTSLRTKIKRDINATEFLSPVSYVRMYDHGSYTDVIITLKEMAPLRLYAKAGNLLATFSLDERYLRWSKDEWRAVASDSPSHDQAVDMAEDLTTDESAVRLMAQFASTSDLPYGVLPPNLAGDAFNEVPVDGGQRIAMAAGDQSQYNLNAVGSTGYPNSSVDNHRGGNSNYNNYNYYHNNDNNNDNNSYNYNNYLEYLNNTQDNSTQPDVSSNNGPSQENNNNNHYYNNNPNLEGYEESFLDQRSRDNLQWQLRLQQDLDAGQGVELIEGLEIIDQMYIQAVAQNTTQSPDDEMENLLGLQSTNSYNTADAYSANPYNPAVSSPDNLANNPTSVDEQQGYATYEEANQATQAPPLTHPVNLEFRNAQLSDVINILGAENNINFIYNLDEFKGKTVTIQLKNVSWTHALRAVLDIYNLGFERLSGSVIKIQSADKITRSRRLAKTKLLIMPLSYIKVEDAVGIIGAFIGGGSGDGGGGSGNGDDSAGGAGDSGGGASGAQVSIDKNIAMTTDERTNSLIIEAPVDELSKIKALVERLDTQTPQVKIDARIIEVQNSNNHAYGVKWGSGVNFDSAAAGLNMGSLPLNFQSKFAVAAPASTGASKLALRLTPLTNFDSIDMQLEWEERYLDTRILQNTSVIVLNNHEASISSGLEDTFVVTGGEGSAGGSVSVSYKLGLSVKPQVTSDGSVLMEVAVNSDDPVDSGEGSSRSSTKSVSTSLMRASGETAVIGGIYTTSTTEGVTGMPLLNKLPIIGWIFRNSIKNTSKREVLILLTPTILNMDDSLGTGGQLAELDNYSNYENSNEYSNSYGAAGNYQNYDNQNYLGNTDNGEYAQQAYADQEYAQNYEYEDNEYDEGSQAYEQNYNQEYSANYAQTTSNNLNSYNNSYGDNAAADNYDQGYEYQNPSGGQNYSDDDYYDDDAYDQDDADYYSSGT